MPAGGASGNSNNAAGRTVFRPPWVKDGPSPIPMPTAPWTLRNKEAAPSTNVTTTLPQVQLRKVGPRQNGATKSTANEPAISENEAKVVPIRREREEPIRSERPKLASQKTINEPEVNSTAATSSRRQRPPVPPAQQPVVDDVKKEARKVIEREIPVRPSLIKQDSLKSTIPPPPAPPAPPPPPPKMQPSPNDENLTKRQKAVLEALRARPRKRPDWATMMKEVEQGKKLNHVVCNDRSKPLLPAGKAKTKDGQFVYESEKSNIHNQLLKQIQGGINLKRVQTNDRSKPILDGLRKFRRQMTIEEQIQKSQSAVTIPDGEEVAEEADEMDDIDKIRDDLQSTKQLLALELRNKEAAAKEQKRLQARILNLEVELEHERGKAAASVTRSVMAERIEDDKLVASLKQEAEDARKAAKEAEKKYIKASDVMDTTKGELEEAKRQNEILEKKLEAALKALSGGGRRESQPPNGTEAPEMEEEEEESESDDEGEETEEKKERRIKRELKLITNKLRNYKDKEGNARNERKALKEQMKKQQELIKEERKKYKHLQREVDKMAALMKDDNDEEKDEEDDEDKDSEMVSDEEDEEETDSESESSSESEDEEDEKSESEAEDAPFEKRKENYTTRVRRHENCLAALKKGNYLLKANIDRLKDDLNKQREMSLTLQEDLDSVLAELG